MTHRRPQSLSLWSAYVKQLLQKASRLSSIASQRIGKWTKLNCHFISFYFFLPQHCFISLTIFDLWLPRITSPHLKLAGEGNLMWLRCAFSSVNLASSASVLGKSFYFIRSSLKSRVLKSLRQKQFCFWWLGRHLILFSLHTWHFRKVCAYFSAIPFPKTNL